MDDFDKLVLLNLEDRCRLFQKRILALRNDPDLKMHADIVNGELRDIIRDIERLKSSPAIDDRSLNPQHSQLLARLGEREFVVEAYVGPALLDFDVHDRRLTRIVRKLAEEISWPIPAPLVVASSDGGYMTFMRLFLMKVPAMEDEKLLAYPDLVHEMGHILMMSKRRELLGDFPAKLRDYFQRENSRSDAPPLPQYVQQNWPNWLQEYVCDMLAVYTFGKSFATQHRNLVSLMEARSFIHADSHPADESRLRAAAFVLRAMGDDAGADEVLALWQQRMDSTRERKPSTYERTAPDEILKYLAERVVDGSRKLGIRPFTAPQPQNSIVRLIQEGWDRARRDPADFLRWEKQRLRFLWRSLGLDDATAKPGTGRGETPPAPGGPQTGTVVPLAGRGTFEMGVA